MSNNLSKLIGTFFYVGFMPVAPGTMASACGVVLYIFLQNNFVLYSLTLFILTVLGFLSAEGVEKIVNEKDPSCVVIDEVVGMMIAMFLLPLTPEVIITAFFLFRAFDMFKIYPINRFEDLHGGAGIMMDDVIGGIYTNLTMQVALQLKAHWGF